ncbi:tetratricopeptide repeat protein [Aequorivita viscosa]|nr:tetratricopeptide repeat protein [Aequorivita viscosa]
MKNLLFSLLFFCLLFSLGSPTTLHAQAPRDTIYKYYNAIVFPNGETTISEGINFFTQKKEKDSNRHDTISTIQDLRLIAQGQYSVGNFTDSEIAVVEALTLIDSYPHKDTLIDGRKGLYNQLGNNYGELKNYTKAIEAYNLSISFSKTKKDSITLLNNIALIYRAQDKYEKAAEQLELARKKVEKDSNSLQFALVLDNLGHIQSKLGNPDAIINLKKALAVREAKNNMEGIYASNKNFALYYFDRNNKNLATNYANKAYEVANTLESITYLKDALSLFAIMNEDPKIVQFKQISDSIAKKKQLAENKNAFFKYNVANEKKKTSEALLAREKQKNQKLIFLILGVIILLTSIYIFFALRIKHKKERIEQVHNTESRISKKVHDEVANDVYQLMAKIQGNTNNNEAVLDDLEKIYNKTRDISNENSAIEIEENFSEQLNDLLLNYQTQSVSIVTRNISKLKWESISEIKKITLYRVLQELMTNMKKHSKASAVVLAFQQNGKKINIEYSDNGVGCTLKDKNGLQNAENRIKTLNGTIIFDSQPTKGFKAKITL